MRYIKYIYKFFLSICTNITECEEDWTNHCIHSFYLINISAEEICSLLCTDRVSLSCHHFIMMANSARFTVDQEPVIHVAFWRNKWCCTVYTVLLSNFKYLCLTISKLNISLLSEHWKNKLAVVCCLVTTIVFSQELYPKKVKTIYLKECESSLKRKQE